MNEFASSFVWAAIQVSLLSVIVMALVLAARKWLSGIVGELLFVTMSLIILIPALAMIPVPSWFPAQPDRTIAESTDLNINTSIVEASTPSPSPTPDRVEVSRSAGPIEIEGSGTTTEPASFSGTINHWWNDFRSIPIVESSEETVVGSVFPWPIVIGGFLLLTISVGGGRLLYGVVGLTSLKQRSREIFDPSLLKIATELNAQMSINKPVAVFETDELSTAATIGWWKPTILLPSDWESWSDGEKVSAISHELAHVHNNDFIKNLVAQFAVALNFFNPLVHWLGQELRVCQELGADEKAAQATGGRTAYLLTMAEMALKQDTNQLGWLAQPFLPTRKTFLRRIEMLKSKRRLRGSRNGIAIWTTRIAVGVIALACICFRVPVNDLVAQDRDSVATTAPAEQSEHNKLAYVSDRAKLFVSADLKELGKVEGFTEMLLHLTGENLTGEKDNRAKRFFVDLEDSNLITIQFFDSMGFGPSRSVGMVIRFNKELEFERAGSKSQTYRGHECFDMGGGAWYHLPDSQTMLFGSDRDALHAMLNAGEAGPNNSKWTAKADEHLAKPLTIAISQLGLETLTELARGEFPFSPLWEDSVYCVGSLSAESDQLLRMAATMEGKSEKKAEQVAQVVRAWVLLAPSILETMQGNIPDDAPDTEFAKGAFKVGQEFLKNFDVQQSANDVAITSKAELDEKQLSSLFLEFGDMYWSAQSSADSIQRIRQLALAMHNYADTNRRDPDGCKLPFSAITAKGSEHKHSWRIAILPYLEESAIYEQYRFEEAWDSEHNRKVTAEMPDCFRHPSQGADETSSGYYLITGTGTVFPPADSIALEKIPDGTSNTILLVAAKRDTHWAKPEDINFDPETILKAIGGFEKDYTTIALCDGSSARFYRGGENELEVLKSMILANDGVTPAWRDRE
jgi:beta-lactamase regulating signal transducer with metallopeptidase domain